MSFHIYSTPPSPLRLRIQPAFDGISLRRNLMKPTYHYYNIMKIMNKGHNQLKDLTIIRRTKDVRLRDCVRNDHLDYFLLNIMIPAINHINSSQFEAHNYFIISQLFQLNMSHSLKLRLLLFDDTLMVDFATLIVPGGDTFVDTVLPNCTATVCMFVCLSKER